MNVGQIVEIADGRKYLFSLQHRRASKYKSKWIISLNEELQCFKTTCDNNWINGIVGWGLHINNGIICCLGENNQNIKLKIAKFVDKNSKTTWHGYPADYVNNIQDRPSTLVLTNWVERKLIDKINMLRILRGMSGGI